MQVQCICVVSVLFVVIVGLLVMTRVVSLEAVGNVICRGFGMLMIALMGLCILKGLLLPILTLWLVRLKETAWWVLMFVFGTFATTVLLRVLVRKIKTPVPNGEHRDGGEL